MSIPAVIRSNALALPLADNSVDLIVTSPPYFALRSYQDSVECKRCRELREGYASSNTESWEIARNLREAWPDYDAHVAAEHKPSHYAGQIGSEATPAAFVDALIAATREMVRVVKPSGSIWVNLGDKYSSNSTPGPQSQNSTMTGGRHKGVDHVLPRRITPGAPNKSLLGVPWRYALRCIDDLGLILRAEVIWSKPNGLPESVTDRVRRSHEQWFHFTLEPRYYSAVDEIREQYAPGTAQRYAAGYGTQRKLTGAQLSKNTDYYVNDLTANPLGKLPGSVWEIATEPLKVPAELGIDHFAAFPMEWPRRIIQGWSPSGVCTACGEGRRPATASGGLVPSRAGDRLLDGEATTPGRLGEAGRGDGGSYVRMSSGHGFLKRERTITGYVCACLEPTAPTTPAVVLDPFGGTGTTALVAKALGRRGISVDMSADYCRLARWRTTDEGEYARALQVPKPAVQAEGQTSLFDLLDGADG